MNKKKTPPKPSDNNVYSLEFQSKMDDQFKTKTKVKDHLTRAASIKIEGVWT